MRRRVPGGYSRGLAIVLSVAGAIFVVVHFADLERFLRLLRQAQPIWLLAAVGLQALTYISVAMGWKQVLAKAENPRKLSSLLPIALSKLFADQAVPAAGMGGNLLLIDRLTRLGVFEGHCGCDANRFLDRILRGLCLPGAGHDLGIMAATRCDAPACRPCDCVPDDRTGHTFAGALAAQAWQQAAATPNRTVQADCQASGSHRRCTGGTGQRSSLVGSCIRLQQPGLPGGFDDFGGGHDGHGPSVRARGGIPWVDGRLDIGDALADPNGLGTFEAAATAMLVSLGAPFEGALASVLVLRGFTLWLPLFPSFYLLRKGGYVNRAEGPEGR